MAIAQKDLTDKEELKNGYVLKRFVKRSENR
jgi:hypothetical protein